MFFGHSSGEGLAGSQKLSRSMLSAMRVAASRKVSIKDSKVCLFVLATLSSVSLSSLTFCSALGPETERRQHRSEQMTSSILALGQVFDSVEPSETRGLETVPPEARVQHQPESSPPSGKQDRQPRCPCEIPTAAHSLQNHP